MSNAGGQDKQLKISVVVDNNAMQQFKRSIGEATAEVSKLVAELNRASGLLGGAGKGLLSGVSAKGTGSAGSSSSPSRGSIGGSISSPVEAIGKGLRDMAKGSVDALKSMTQAVKSNFSGQVSDIIGLEKQLAKLEERYTRLNALAETGSSKTRSRAQSMMTGSDLDRSGLQAQIEGHKAARDSNMEQDSASEWWKSKASAPSASKWSRFSSFATGDLLSGSGNKGSAWAPPDPDGASAGSKLRLAAGAYGLFRVAAAGVNENIASYDRYSGHAAALGSTFGGMGLGMMRGQDYTTRVAMLSLQEDSNRLQIQENAKAKAIADAAMAKTASRKKMQMAGNYDGMSDKEAVAAAYADHGMKAPVNAVDVRAGGDNGGSDLRGASYLARAAATVMNGIGGGASGIIGLPGSLLGMENEQKLRAARIIEEKKAASAADINMRAAGRFQGEWQGMMGLQRAAGTKDPWKLDARLAMSGYNGGDYVGGLNSVAGMGGFGVGQKFANVAMRGSTGHVANIGSFIGASAQTGANGGDMAHFLAGSGFDPFAQSAMAGTLIQQMQNGSAMQSPAALMAVMQAGGNFGGKGNSAEQMRIQSGMAGGMNAANGNLFGGGIDNLQKARNYYNATKATHGNLFGSNYLAEHFDMNMLAGARAGQKLPTALRVRGLTSDMVKDYGNRTLSTMFRNIGLDKGPMGDMARSMLSGGYGSDFGGYLKDHSKGLKKKDRRANEKEATATFGAILQSEGFANSDQEGEGMARLLAGLSSPGTLKKGHFADSAHGTLQAKAAMASGLSKMEEARKIAENPILTDGKRLLDPAENSAMGKKLGELSTRLDLSADDFIKALERLSGAIVAVAEGAEQLHVEP